MSGPWEDFKASSTQVEAGPWDDFSPKEEPTEKNMRGERVSQFYKDVGQGALETAGALGSNLALTIPAGLAGLANLPSGIDAAVEAIDKVYGMGYQPKTEVGKRGTENVGKALNLIPEIMGEGGEFWAGNEGKLAGEIYGNFVTDLLPLRAIKAPKWKSKSAAKVEPKLNELEKELDKLTKKDESNPATGKVDNTYFVDENGIALRQDDLVNVELAKKQQAADAQKRQLTVDKLPEEVRLAQEALNKQDILDLEITDRVPDPNQLELPFTNDVVDRISKNQIDSADQLDLFEHKTPDVLDLKQQQQEDLFNSRPQTDERVQQRRAQEAAKAEQEAQLAELEQQLRESAYTPQGDLQGPKTRAWKSKEIGKRGLANSQTGAFTPEVFTFGVRGITRKLSELTDKLGNDPVWMRSVRGALGGHDPLKNPDGTPMVMLHGTTAEINGKLRGSNQGFHAGYGPDANFFTQKANGEGKRSYLNTREQRSNAQMYPIVIKDGVYPTIKADAGDWSPKEILRTDRDSSKPIRDYISDALRRTGYTDTQIEGFYNYVNNQRGVNATNQAFTDVLKRAGIDGFFYENKAESPKTDKLFRMVGRDDIPARRNFVRNEVNHPKSFVTWSDRNFTSVYAAKGSTNKATPGKITSGSVYSRQRGAIDPKAFVLRFPEFKNSKITDEVGNLKPLIRGVRNDYPYPERTSLGKFGRGVYLTENKQVADIFAGKSGNTRQAYVNMVHPYEISMADERGYREALSRSSLAAEEFAQALRDKGHDGIILRDRDGTIREAVVFDPENVKNAFTLPKQQLSLKNRPIGQRGLANSQTGAIMLPFGKRKGSLPEQIEAVQKQIDDLGRRYTGTFSDPGTLSFEDFSKANHDLIGKKIALEQELRKNRQGEPAKEVKEVFPGYKIIPIGTIVMAKNGLKYPEPTRGTVVATHGFRYGEDAYNLPVVDFGDGQPRKILPSDISEVFGGPRDPFKGPGKYQAGAIRLPFGRKPAVDQLKKIEGIKNDPQMRNIFPEKLSVDEVIKEHAARKTPDVDQNFMQKAINHLTKGSLYQAIKTDNPIIRVVGEKIRQANNAAMEATGRLVHDGLAPLARDLSKQEKADVWAVQQMAEAKGVTLTPDFLQKQGFNQKQIDWVMEHKSVMDDMYQRMSDSMRAAGLEPVSPRVAYLASRARGDFRRLIMKDDKVVGIMGDNTRMGLNKQIERLKKDHPEYQIGEERYYGGRAAKGSDEGLMSLMDFLSKDNPDFKVFVDHVNDMLTQDAFQYMNAKSHTMQKKGVFGMEGRKVYTDAVKNAQEGMQAQIRYAETMIKWSELSKAIAEVKPLLKADNGLDMPNAKEWANQYIQGALGNSPHKLGEFLDAATASVGKSTGIGTTIPTRAVSAMKSYVNGILLGFVNAGFLTANALQLPRTMPEMAAWLNSKGIEAGYDLGLGRALVTLEKSITGQKLSDLEKGAFEYAKKNHVYSSNLFESGNTVNKGLSYYWQKGTQMIASPLERETRKAAFFAYVHMLDETGFKPSDGLYEAAQNLTDMHMNNYSQAEAPRVYQETGSVGRSAYNLMSFKHNELSRLAMFAREVPKGQVSPTLVAMASQVAFAGLLGTIGFQEADKLFEYITGKMGKPTSMTKLLLDNPEIPDALKFGIGSFANVDLTSRMGLQITPESLVDLAAPGFSKLGDIAGAAGDLITQPNAYNAANLVREAAPLSVGGIMDRTWFETDNGMALNRNKVTASAVRNDADKLWKALGMTGVNESVQKKLSYENQKIDQVYKDKRSKVIDGAIKEYYMRGVLPDSWVKDFVELQGDPKDAIRAINDRIESLNVDRPTKEIMKNAASKSVTSQHKLLRRLGQE